MLQRRKIDPTLQWQPHPDFWKKEDIAKSPNPTLELRGGGAHYGIVLESYRHYQLKSEILNKDKTILVHLF